MGEFIVEDVHLKKGEAGSQKFIIFESDGITRRDGTGKTYDFKFWKTGATVVKGGGSLTGVIIAQGEWAYTVVAGDVDTIDEYKGEVIEDPAGVKLRSETFAVFIEESSDLT